MEYCSDLRKQLMKTFLRIILAALICCGCNSVRVEPADMAEGLSVPADLRAGDRLTFGSYEQDNDPENGSEPIEWQVLSVENGRALVISSVGLDAKAYNGSYVNVTWKTSALRKWLNADFFTGAFSPVEQGRIAEVKNENPRNQCSRAWGGDPTKDHIFLLNFDEANRYFADDEARQCAASEYAKANGAFIGENGKSWWWLRTPGKNNFTAAVTLYDGYAASPGHAVIDKTNLVRPAFWLILQ